MSNKVEFGLSNVHIAFEKAGGWEKPIPLPGAISFSPSAEGEDFHFYADDIDYYSEFTDNGYTGELTMATLPDWFLGHALGYQKDKNGALVEVKNAPKKKFCLIFEGKGDKKKRRFMFINCGCGKPSEEFKTVEDKKEIRVQSLPLTVSGDPKTGAIKMTFEQGTANYDTILTAIPAKFDDTLAEIPLPGVSLPA